MNPSTPTPASSSLPLPFLRAVFWLLAGSLALLVVGCGVSSPYMTKLETPRATTADASAATVVFIRPSNYAGRQKHVIFDAAGNNPRFLGECWGETYFVAKVPPGEHMFVSWGEGTPALKATVEAGKVYYVEVGATIGAWSARARLFAMGPSRESWEKLPEWLAESKMLVADEAAGQAYLRERGDETTEVMHKGIQNYADYDAEAKGKRTLLITDGVAAPVTPQPG